MSAMENQGPGIPLLSMFWRQEISDVSADPRPQEFASPAFAMASTWAEDRLFMGSHSGWFYSMVATTGEILWKKEIGSVSSRPLLHRGRIYVGTDDGFLICMNSLGDEQWRYTTGAAILQEPVISGDSLIVSNEGDQVYALDLETGKFRWLYKTDADAEFTLRGHSGVVVDGDLVYAGFADGSMVALRSATGSVAWLSSLKGSEERFVDVDTTPVISGDTVFAASSSGGLFAMDKATGRIRWNREVSGGGGLLATEKRLYFVAAELGVHALDHDGNVIWRQGTRGGGEASNPIVHGEHLIFNLSEDGIFVAKADTGEVVQYFDPGSGISAQPTMGRQNLYVMSNGAVLYSLGVEEL
jgi:outer membrane protein assembly factor BamB